MKIRLATLKDAKEIHKLMWDVYEQLPDKSIFVPDSYEWVCEHMEKKGFILWIPQICYFMVRYPKMDDDNLGLDMGLSKDELLKVAHMESCVVSPTYRGQHLQQKLFALAEESIDKSKYSYLMGTAAPTNYASCRSFEKSGFTCILEKEKYDGKMRRIYLKEICLSHPF